MDDKISIIDQYYELISTTKTLKVLREGIREATPDELEAWQDIMDIVLEREVVNLNSVLLDFSQKFNDLEYEPIKTEDLGGSYSTRFMWDRIEKATQETKGKEV